MCVDCFWSAWNGRTRSICECITFYFLLCYAYFDLSLGMLFICVRTCAPVWQLNFHNNFDNDNENVRWTVLFLLQCLLYVTCMQFGCLLISFVLLLLLFQLLDFLHVNLISFLLHCACNKFKQHEEFHFSLSLSRCLISIRYDLQERIHCYVFHEPMLW